MKSERQLDKLPLDEWLTSNALSRFFDFGFGEIEKHFEEAEKELHESIAKLEKRIKKTKNGMTVTVPYDRSKEKLSTEIKDGILTVEVKSEDGTSIQTTSVTLPNDFDDKLKGVYRQYDEDKHEMHVHFSFKKK